MKHLSMGPTKRIYVDADALQVNKGSNLWHPMVNIRQDNDTTLHKGVGVMVFGTTKTIYEAGVMYLETTGIVEVAQTESEARHWKLLK